MPTATAKQLIKKSKRHAFGKDIFLLGTDNEGVNYWLEAPKWDRGWYWGFGYVETYTNNAFPEKARDINSHQHIDSSFMGKIEFYNVDKKKWDYTEYIHNIYDAPKLSQTTTFTENEGWELSELFQQFYFLRTAAENFGRGKCHTANATVLNWANKDLAKDINERIIPAVTARILEILTPTI